MNKWDKRFIELAKCIASWSKDPSTKVGAVIVDLNHRIISVGFNGFAQGVKDSTDKLNNREQKYPRIIHAEVNAILFSQRNLLDCIIYVWPMPPCARCASIIIQSGIKEVVTIHPTTEELERWGTDIEIANNDFWEAGVTVRYLL